MVDLSALPKVRRLADLKRRKKSDATAIYCTLRLSMNTVNVLLNVFPNVKEIYMPRSLIKLTPEELKNYLKEKGVELKSTNRGRGRPPKYDEKTIKTVVDKYKAGESPEDIAKELGIPARSVYYILRRQGVY